MNSSPVNPILFWMQHGTETPLPEHPKPLKVPVPPRTMSVGPLKGCELTLLPSWTYRKVMPLHVWGAFAVYELAEGQFTVTRNGDTSGTPFVTTDADLARMVCNRWAVEFQAVP